MDIPASSNIIEPFVGNGDLIRWCESQKIANSITCYDIQPPESSYATNIFIQDTLLHPPSYEDKFIVTNPPYLAKNKTKMLSHANVFAKWNTSDLYKAFIKSFCQQNPAGGVIIVPLNFLCDAKGTEAREQFLSKFKIRRINIFEDSVFEDTSYTVCSILFTASKEHITSTDIPAVIYPTRKKIFISLSERYGWKIGGEIFNSDGENKYKISRLTSSNISPHSKCARDKSLRPEKPNKITNLLLHCVDGKGQNKESMIRLELNPVPLFGKDTDRSFCTLVVDPPINQQQQIELVAKFNTELDFLRKKYHSLFLTNFREFGRKRISFSTAFNILQACLNELSE